MTRDGPGDVLTSEIYSDKAYAYAIWLTYFLLLSLPFTRMLNGLNLVFITALAWIFLLFHWKRKFIPSSLIYFTIVANSYFLLSFLNIFPQIWTTEFEVKAIPQQALFAYSILPLFYLFFVFMVYFLHSEIRLKKMLKIILFLVLYNKLVAAKLNGFDTQIFFSIAGLGNISALMILGFMLAVGVVKSGVVKYLIIFSFVLMSLWSPYNQNIVYALMALILLATRRFSFTFVVGFIFSTVIFYLFFMQDPMLVHFIDQNLTVRLVLIQDAIDGLIQSNFIGVGFGTESIKNHYNLFENPTFANQDAAGFIHLSVHNSFATIAYRLGVLGLFSLLFFLYKTLKMISNMKENQPQALAFFLCFYIVCFQNPALESFIYLIGAYLMLAATWALGFAEMGVKNQVQKNAEYQI